MAACEHKEDVLIGTNQPVARWCASCGAYQLWQGKAGWSAWELPKTTLAHDVVSVEEIGGTLSLARMQGYEMAETAKALHSLQLLPTTRERLAEVIEEFLAAQEDEEWSSELMADAILGS